MRNVFNQFLRFTGVGAIGTFAHYVILIILVQIIGIPPVPSSVTGFVVGALVNYHLNYRFTFRSKKNHSETLIKFLVIALVGLMLNTLIMAMATVILLMNYFLAQMIATGIVLIWNFTGNRLWTFKEGRYATKL